MLANLPKPSTRAEITERRTYLRPLNDEGTLFETFEQSIDRQIEHQRWLWEQAKAGMQRDVNGEVILESLTTAEEEELSELRSLLLARKVTLSGRTSWLGGTSVAKTRQSSLFNCSFLEVATVYDVVDVLWLLLQGCGVGFRPIIGTLNGFMQYIPEIEVIRTKRKGKGGAEHNKETFDRKTGVWTIKVGDSAEAWAKSIGKLVAGKHPASKLVIDLSEIRPAGDRLKGYGWISSGDQQIAIAYKAIADIFNKAAGRLLTRIEILDLINWLGTVLSSRRSAEICLIPFGEDEWEEFAVAKLNYWSTGNPQRAQSNNTLMFFEKPSRADLTRVFDMMKEAGGSEPGFNNSKEALRRAPWFKGANPCATAEHFVMTSQGQRQIFDLIDVPYTAIVDGVAHSSTGFWKAGTKPVFKIDTSRGMQLRLTGNHEVKTSRGMVAVDNLTEGDEIVISANYGNVWGEPDKRSTGWILGEIVGNGGYSVEEKYHAYARFWGDDAKVRAQRAFDIVDSMPIDYPQPKESTGPVYNHINKTYQVMSKRLTSLCSAYLGEGKKILPSLEKESSSFLEGFLQGWFDADGTVIGSIEKGRSIRLSSIHIANLRSAQRMLLSLGIVSTIYQNRKNEGSYLMPDGKGGSTYYSGSASHELVVSRDAIRVFVERVGFSKKDKLEKSLKILEETTRGLYKSKFITKVVSITPDGEEDVYDCTVDDVHLFSANGLLISNCHEILLGNKSFCNLVETVLSRFNGEFDELLRAHYIIARANYRQTCVDLEDGILQRSWHESNEFLRLTGVGVTGVVSWEGVEVPAMWEDLRSAAHKGVHSMADELGTPRSKAVTTIKPSGTKSKTLSLEGMEIAEGLHKPLGRYIFNNILFSKHDPMVKALKEANYRYFDHPFDNESILITVPVDYSNIPFDKVILPIERNEQVYKGHGDFETITYVEDTEVEVNLESALKQLERYKTTMSYYVDHNSSVTIYYDLTEVEGIIDWFMENWDNYVGVSFLYRTDPTKTAKDLGYQYLPQEVVDERTFREYADSLKPINWDGTDSELDVDSGADCATGACPVR